MDNDKNWETMVELAKYHNKIGAGRMNFQEIEDYVRKNKESLKFQQAIEILLETIEMTDEFVDDKKEFCSTVIEIIKGADIKSSDLEFRSAVRLERFLEMMNNR